MNRFLSAACAAMVSVLMAVPSAGQALSAPLRSNTPSVEFSPSVPVTNVQDQWYGNRRQWRAPGHRQWRGPGYRRWPHENYRHRYYRHRHDDFGPVVGGLVAGVIISGIIASQQPAPRYRYYRYSGDAHVDWCLRRYRSYDIRTDTFQPYHGPRRYCNSPYR